MDLFPRSPLDLPQPNSPAAVERTFRGYRLALQRMGTPDLLAELTRINAALQADRQARMTSLLSRAPSTSSSIDDPVLRSTPRETPERRPVDRGSRPSPSSPAPTPLDRWAASRGLGRRLAAKIATASLRAQSESTR